MYEFCIKQEQFKCIKSYRTILFKDDCFILKNPEFFSTFLNRIYNKETIFCIFSDVMNIAEATN